MDIRTLHVDGLDIPFIVDDHWYYNFVNADDDAYLGPDKMGIINGCNEDKALEKLDGYMSNYSIASALQAVPFIYYDGNYETRSGYKYNPLDIAQKYFPNIKPTSKNSSDIIKIGDYTLGSLLLSANNTVENTRYNLFFLNTGQNLHSNYRFPYIDSHIGYNTSPSYAWSFGFMCSVIPSVAINDDGTFNFSEDTLSNGLVTVELYGGYAKPDEQYSYTKFSYTFFHTDSIAGMSLLNGQKTAIFNPSGGSGEGGGDSEENLDDAHNSSLDIPDGTVEQNDAGAGIYSRWLVSPAQLADMSNYIWQQPLDVLTGLLTAVVGKPIDAIIQLTSYPFNVGSYIGGSDGNIKIGNLVTETTGTKLTSNAGTIDWGTINLASSGFANYCGNFLDFSPYTQYKLYLPWGSGFVDIDANDIISISNGKFSGGSISVRTNFEVGKGTAVHNVYNHLGVVIGSYCCDVGRTIPVIGSDYASKSLRSAVGMIGLALLGGAAIAGAASAIPTSVAAATTAKGAALTAGEKAMAIGQGIGDTISSIPRWGRGLALGSAAAIATGTPNVYRNGAFLEGSAGMNIQYPYLIITKPDMSLPENYARFNGYPSNAYATLGSLSGYTEVAEIHLSGLNATASEVAELENILKGGVIL